MTSIDISTIETQILQAVGIVVASAIGWGVKRWLDKMGIEETQAQTATFDDMGRKVLDYAISKAQDKIAANGWDHVQTKGEIIAVAAQQAIAKFPDAMKAVGIDPAAPGATEALVDGLLTRQFPDRMAVAAASPATPPVAAAPPQVVVVPVAANAPADATRPSI